MQETDSWVRKIHWRRERLPTPVFLAFPCGLAVKNLPEMWETWVWSLGWEDPLEKGKATHSSILAWRIPWTVQSMGRRVRHNWATFTFSEADVIAAIGMNVVLEDVRKLIQSRCSQGGFLEEVTLFNWDLKGEQEFAWEWKGIYAVMQKKKGGGGNHLSIYWV